MAECRTADISEVKVIRPPEGFWHGLTVAVIEQTMVHVTCV